MELAGIPAIVITSGRSLISAAPWSWHAVGICEPLSRSEETGIGFSMDCLAFTKLFADFICFFG